uniref:Putative thiol-disulfide isomerase and thioredoxin n=1 Tax=Ixodes ricinus TaxID=34613 RepID=A0A0K8RKC7_IXORI
MSCVNIKLDENQKPRKKRTGQTNKRIDHRILHTRVTYLVTLTKAFNKCKKRCSLINVQPKRFQCCLNLQHTIQQTVAPTSARAQLQPNFSPSQ